MSDKDRRTRELAQIHLGAKELQMDDDAYRAMLWSVARVRSAKDLDAGGRERVISHLKALGFRPKRKGRSTPAKSRRRLIQKIKAQLTAAEYPDAYADGMARKMFGVERYEWCNADQLHKLVSALTYDAQRRGRTE